MKNLIALLFLLGVFSANAQYINRDAETVWKGRMAVGKQSVTPPDQNVWLEVGDSGTSKSMLLPRVSATASVPNPKPGMFHYDLSTGKLYYRNATGWKPVGDSAQNFANADLTATGSRTHNFGGNTLTLNFSRYGQSKLQLYDTRFNSEIIRTDIDRYSSVFHTGSVARFGIESYNDLSAYNRIDIDDQGVTIKASPALGAAILNLYGQTVNVGVSGGEVKVPGLAGAGVRMVVADSMGKLAAQPIPPLTIEMMSTSFQTLVAYSQLVTGRVYHLTDLGVYVKAISNKEIDAVATRKMLVPATYATTTDAKGNNWLGIWQPSLAPAVGDLVIWGAHVWKNLTGSTGAVLDMYTLNPEDWQLVPKTSFANGEYVEKKFACAYDPVNNWIAKQWDENGNTFGMTYTEAGWSGLHSMNPVDYSDWNLASIPDFLFYENKVPYLVNNVGGLAIYRNSGGAIFNNRFGGLIAENKTFSGIMDNAISGDIWFNYCQSIIMNTNSGSINGNVGFGGIGGNSNNGDITSNYIIVSFIENNSNNGHIMANNVTGNISNNTNAGNIDWNQNGGGIEYNSIQGYIAYNKNNGSIMGNHSDVPVNIYRNSNNGDIGGAYIVRTADVTDTVVHK